MNLRLSSPFIAAGADYTTYLLGQYSDLQSYCTTSMALTTASTSLILGTMTVPTTTTISTTSTSGTASPSTTCAGQTINPPATPMSCNALSAQYGVTTGDLTVLTNDWACQFASPICAPLACDTMKTGWNETWYDAKISICYCACSHLDSESLRKSISTSSNNVTTAQFSTWNWRIVGKCDSVRGDQYVCKGSVVELIFYQGNTTNFELFQDLLVEFTLHLRQFMRPRQRHPITVPVRSISERSRKVQN